MRKRILPWFCLLLLCISAVCPLGVNAEAVDPQKDASLTLCYQKDGYAFSDLNIRIFRVAAVSADGTYDLLEPFSTYPINIYGITTQLQWDQVADTLYSSIVANGVAPYRQNTTGPDGVVRFEQLETGMYFVESVTADAPDATCIFNRFLVCLPTPEADGTFRYSVEARPKCSHYLPKTQYTVNKLWQDSGYADSRPGEVTVDIYRNGALQETKTLNSQNHWSYSWKVAAGDTGVWTVSERNVPEHYKVKVTQTGSVFSITNSRQSQPQTPPTGDTFTPLPWILALCLSGLGVLMLALYRRRFS